MIYKNGKRLKMKHFTGKITTVPKKVHLLNYWDVERVAPSSTLWKLNLFVGLEQEFFMLPIPSFDYQTSYLSILRVEVLNITN